MRKKKRNGGKRKKKRKKKSNRERKRKKKKQKRKNRKIKSEEEEKNGKRILELTKHITPHANGKPLLKQNSSHSLLSSSATCLVSQRRRSVPRQLPKSVIKSF